MERPFWTAGPIPPSRLGDLALPRPTAFAAAMAALGSGQPAWIGGPRGSGRSTLLGQVVAALGRPTLAIDAQALLKGTEDEALASAAQEVGLRGGTPTWAAILAQVGPDAVLAIDGLEERNTGWAGALASLGVPLVLTGDGGRLVPDPIAAFEASAFLERGASRVRVGWTATALREAVALANGHPARLQAIGAACLHVALEQGRRRIAMDDYLEAALEVSQVRPGQGPLVGLSGPRLELLKAAVRDPSGSPSSWAERCGLEARAAVVHLGRLVAQGWLERPERGRYAIADPAVGLHLQGRFATIARVVKPGGAASRTR